MVPGGQAGVTLVELAVALGTLAVLLALGLPSLQGWRDKGDLRDAVAGISEAMLTSRSRAVVERRTYTVSVDYGNDTWSVAPVDGSVRHRGEVDLYADASDPDCPPLSAEDISFRANGTADAAGFEAVFLRSRSARVPERYRVKVLGATGKVTVERSSGGAWVGAY